MQNHALEIAKSTDYHVYLVGYLENRPHEKIMSNESIEIVDISSKLVNTLRKLPKILYLVYAALRILIQIFILLNLFLRQLQKPDFIIVQNPPSIPGLAILFLISRIKRIKLLIDFHNYGYSIVALNIRNKFVIKLARKYEEFFGRFADYKFAVSDAMRKDLNDNWRIESSVLYDKANLEIFRPINMDERHELFQKLGLKGYTVKKGSSVEYEQGRPILLVSATSWTSDEDFSIVVNALENYDTEAKQAAAGRFPRLNLIITGKGPLKEQFFRGLEQKRADWTHINIESLWLEANDYPKLLAAADLGICLHYSSSGVDLPMKVVDMFGAGLPVLAINYKSIGELVQDDKNGKIFKDANDLQKILKDLFIDFPKNQGTLERLKREALKFRERTFQDEWRDVVLPLIKDTSSKKGAGKKA
eukprot:TRINITY_DN9935_c0_g1_i4.p1 TRINITY_DN9935_c0_g1~~TRINITY_DN9935_c0_g1_i4.p1  ORF type:complete len:418 (+),score=108.25 TRINITY_DN9935_c0_g1_i4:1092-2345(+)